MDHTSPRRTYSVRFLRGDMSARTVTGFPVLHGALDLARELVLDGESSLVGAHVLDGERVLATVTVFDSLIDDWFALAAAARTS